VLKAFGWYAKVLSTSYTNNANKICQLPAQIWVFLAGKIYQRDYWGVLLLMFASGAAS
jgi:hypothetical protein